MKEDFDKSIAILDLACGTGIIGEALAKLGYTEIVGIDGSAKMLEVAEQKKCYKKLEQGMIGMGTFPKEFVYKFDVVIATGMFSKGHVTPAGADDIIAALRSGGLAFFSVRDDYVDELGYSAKFKLLEEEGQWELKEAIPFDNYASNEGHKFLYPSKNKIYVYRRTGTGI